MRKTRIETAFFPVELQPVFAKGGRELPGLRALVDVHNEHVFDVVSKNYQLVTNEQAADYGRQCFACVFGEQSAREIDVYHINLADTGSTCTMDFTHQGSGFEPFAGDAWVPFLRVSNSYNRSMSLGFRVGFCRDICTNGVIYGDRSIHFRFEHTHRGLRRIDFRSLVGDTGALQAAFMADLLRLRQRRVRRDQMLPLACRVMRVSPGEEDVRNRRKWRALIGWRDRVIDLTGRYFGEMGENAYAALGVLTDFASRPTHVRSGVVATDQLQRGSAAWMSGFLRESGRLGFRMESYVHDYRKYAELLSRN